MKGVAISKTLFLAIGALLFVASLVFLIVGFQVEPSEIRDASRELVAEDVLNRLLTEQHCIGTGQAGVLNVTNLTAANGGKELECAWVPNGGYLVTVQDLTNTNKWSFGYVYPGNGVEKVEAVALAYPNGDVKPGRLIYNFSYRVPDDMLLYVTDQAAKTFYTDREIQTTAVNKYHETWTQMGQPSGDSTICIKREPGYLVTPGERCKLFFDDIKIKVSVLGGNEIFIGKYDVITKKAGGVVEVTLQRRL